MSSNDYGGVPYPGALYIGDEEQEAVTRVIESRRLFRYYGLTDGPSETNSWEDELKQFLNAGNALAVNSGTSAIICALRALGIGVGDEVIVPAYTWVATAAAVVETGATPVVAAIDETLTIDVDDVRRRITPKTRAVIPVHMRGAVCNIGELIELALQHELIIIEDSCQALGATYQGQLVGTFGQVGCYSTQYAKVITTGEGGVLVTDDPAIYLNALDVHDCKNAQRRNEQPSSILGLSLRCSELTAAVGRVQLRRLPSILQSLRQNRSLILNGLESSVFEMVRMSHDPQGDQGSSLVLIAETSAESQKISAVLAEAGLSVETLWDEDGFDQHIFKAWTGVWALAREPKDDAALNASLELLGRSVAISINPQWTENQCIAIASLINRSIQQRKGETIVA